MKAILRRLRVHDSGLTLIELSVAGLMASILLFAAFSALDVGTKAERGQQARHDAMLEIRGAMERLTKDLRQATSMDPTSDEDRIVMNTLVSGVEKRVVYELLAVGGGNHELRRAVSASLSPLVMGPTQTLVTNMVVGTTPAGTPDPPFCYSYYSAGTPSQCIHTANDAGGRVPSILTAIRVTLAKDPEFNPGEPITLATDVQLRNL